MAGTNSVASANAAVAIGAEAKATSPYACALVYGKANGNSSFAAGAEATATAAASTALGCYTIANAVGQCAVGKYNVGKTTTMFEVGSGSSTTARANAFEVLADGTAIAQTGLQIGSTRIDEAKLLKIATIPSLINEGTEITLTDNTEYRLADITDLTLSYPAGAFECWMRITTTATGTVEIAFPDSTHYLGAVPEFGNGETWELSIKDGYVCAIKCLEAGE